MGVRYALVVVVAGLLALVLPAAPALAAPVSTAPPTVSGKAVFDNVLEATAGTWTPAPTTTAYQWLRDGRPIAGATRARYRTDLDDLGRRLAVLVTVTDATGATAQAASAATDPVARAALRNKLRPDVRGVARFTRTVTATPGRWSERPTRVRYQWFRSGREIEGATGQRYTFAPEDVGRTMHVQVQAKAPGYTPGVRGSRRAAVGHRVDVRRSVTYSISTRGRITASVKEFHRQVGETLSDPRGWRGSGVAFREVGSGGSFTVVLAEASTVPGYSSGCSSYYSCRVGRNVIINQDRWRNASPPWNAAGRSLRDYRHMVVNHETGHWLGRGHAGCPRPGRPAPVMMQQSKGRDGCTFNPWPTAGELR